LLFLQFQDIFSLINNRLPFSTKAVRGVFKKFGSVEMLENIFLNALGGFGNCLRPHRCRIPQDAISVEKVERLDT
jgi:hypothetical protein